MFDKGKYITKIRSLRLKVFSFFFHSFIVILDALSMVRNCTGAMRFLNNSFTHSLTLSLTQPTATKSATSFSLLPVLCYATNVLWQWRVSLTYHISNALIEHQLGRPITRILQPTGNTTRWNYCSTASQESIALQERRRFTIPPRFSRPLDGNIQQYRVKNNSMAISHVILAVRTNLYWIIKSTTGKFCSLSFFWIVTL